MTWNTNLTSLDRTTTDTRTLNALARRAPATDDLLELATWLRDHGPAHLSAIERIELAERLITRRRFLIGAGALAVGAMTGCGPAARLSTTRVTRQADDQSGLTGSSLLPSHRGGHHSPAYDQHSRARRSAHYHRRSRPGGSGRRSASTDRPGDSPGVRGHRRDVARGPAPQSADGLPGAASLAGHSPAA